MLKRLTGSRPAQVIQAYGKAQGSNYAAGLAFNAFLAMFPLILGMLAIVGLVIDNPDLQTKIYNGIVSVFPADAHQQILSALTGVKHNAGLLGIVSIVGLLWSGTSLFASMEFALTMIFGTKQRDTLRQRLMGLVMVVVFIAAVLLTVTANSAAAASAGAGVLGAVLGAVVLVALMTLIYRWVPNRTFALRDIWPGALLAGVLIELFSLLFPLYAKISKGFGTYGQQFALFFLLATWLSFMCQFILIGAVFNKMRLGTPTDEGIVAASGEDTREHKDPASAIDEEKRKTPQGRESLPASRPHNSARPRPSPVQTRALLALGATAAALGAVVSRSRRRSNGPPAPR
ncbi:MAG: YihY/virulence factor BrkB family protein [Candidatus Dormibacteraeota bacterium]|nr:YihY/virulence factor BrkB family protein [Candidatus Dormibacteraeota bacterium]